MDGQKQTCILAMKNTGIVDARKVLKVGDSAIDIEEAATASWHYR
jgi:hypothetical protein